jgi:hypothetical protein
MKKELAIALAALAILAGSSVYAGTVTKMQSKTVNAVQQVNNVNTHRYIHVYANREITESSSHHNMTENDWDSGWRRSDYTDAEWAYLKTLTDLKGGTHYYIDLTNETYSTTPPVDYVWVDASVSAGSNAELHDGVLVTTNSTSVVQTQNGDVYQLVSYVYDSSPIMLDLNNDSTPSTAFGMWTKHAPKFFSQYAKFFDITGDGNVDYTEWTTPNTSDALLVKPENGKVETALQLFGTAGGYDNGYEKLSLVCDTDKNGWVEGQELEGLALWMDTNSDGVCQSEELKSLSDYGITAISTDHSNYVSSYKTEDGKMHISWDWWPAVSSTRKFEG